MQKQSRTSKAPSKTFCKKYKFATSFSPSLISFGNTNMDGRLDIASSGVTVDERSLAES